MSDQETCEDRDYKCCDLYPDAEYAALHGLGIPLPDPHYERWYDAHVANYRLAVQS